MSNKFSRFVRAAVVLSCVSMTFTAIPAADITSTWTGATGLWTDPTQWTNNPPVADWPDNGRSGFTYDVVLNDPAHVTFFETTATVDSLLAGGDLTIERSSLTVRRNLTLNNHTITLSDYFTSGNWLRLTGPQTLSGTGQIVSTTPFPRLGNNFLTCEGGDFTIAPGISVLNPASGGAVRAYTDSLRNQGAIITSSPDRNFTVWAPVLINEGLIESTNHSVLMLRADWTNTGTGAMNVNSIMLVDGNEIGRDLAFNKVLDEVKAARDHHWPAHGITSSAAHADSRGMSALAVVLNDDGSGNPLYTLFAGGTIGIDANYTIVKYTWNGDANLDGVVNADDYFLIDSNYIPQNPGWQNGDFNYDAVINADDYFLIDSAFLGQTGPLSVDAPRPFTPIPDPATGGVLLLAVLALGYHRKHRPPSRLTNPG